jgi:iron complex transport system substrate-binding protein
MLGRAIIALLLLCPWTALGTAASAATIADATGRSVQVPDHIAHVLPAGPPAAVLLEALAPDLLMGWPSLVPAEARAMLAPPTDQRPEIPRGDAQVQAAQAIAGIKPDLILDYGTVSPHYIDQAKATQQKTGIPSVLLDGSLEAMPQVLRMLGGVLHREERAETLARFAEAILALPQPPGPGPSVVYARGADGLSVAAPGSDITAVFKRLGWRVLAPEGQGTFRTTTIAAIQALNPDVLIFADPHMHDVLGHSAAWQTVRAAHEGHAYIAPSLPFGWIEEPPSINRLIGLAWLSGTDPGILAVVFNAVVYGHVLTPVEFDAVLVGFRLSQ